MKPQVNLLPHANASGSLNPSLFIQLALVGCLVSLLVGLGQAGWVTWHKQKLNQLNEQNKQIQSLLVETEAKYPEAGLARNLEQQVDILEQTNQENRQLLNLLGAQNNLQTEGFYQYLKALSDNARKGIWLTQIVLDHDQKVIKLKGITLDTALVPGYISDLSKTPFKGSAFGSLTINTLPETDKAWEFILDTQVEVAQK